MPAKHVFVSGTVQGVYFRASTRKKAEEVGVSGWVRNLPDGRVEALFVGEEDTLEEVLVFCHKGPERARVESVEVSDAEDPGDLEGFTVRSTPSA